MPVGPAHHEGWLLASRMTFVELLWGEKERGGEFFVAVVKQAMAGRQMRGRQRCRLPKMIGRTGGMVAGNAFLL